MIVPGGAGGPGDPDATGGPLPGDPSGGIAPMLMMMAAAVVLGSGSLVLAGRRRRPREPDPSLIGAEAGGRALGDRQDGPDVAAPAAWSRPTPVASPAASGEPVVDPVLTGFVPQILPAEAGVPRWRRQSLRDARAQSDRVPQRVPRKLTFAAPPSGDVERSVVRYDLVPLLDHPDEVTGIPIGELRAGDEVEVVGRRAVWSEVLTPTGRTGWVHRTTLDAPAASAPADEPADGFGDEPPEAAQERQQLDEILAAISAQRRANEVAAAALAAAANAVAAAAATTAHHPAEATASAATDRPARTTRGSKGRSPSPRTAG